MKKKIVLAITLLGSVGLYAQTGIGTELPHQTSVLEIASTNKGLLIPRITLLNEKDITTIKGGKYPESLIVYHRGNDDLIAGFYFWEKDKWNALISNKTLYHYIKEQAKPDTVTITHQQDGDYLFTWVDKNGKEESMLISNVIQTFETLTSLTGTIIGEEAVLTYKPERGVNNTILLTDLLKKSTVFEKFIQDIINKTVIGSKTVVVKGDGIDVAKDIDTTTNTTTYKVSVVPAEIFLSGNVNGSLNTSKVIGIQNVNVSPTLPTEGQTLVYNSAVPAWEPGKPTVNAGDITGKANLTTDGVIVIGDAATGTNSSPNSVLAATTLSIKNASITSGKLADKAVTVGKIADGGVNQVLTTTAAGVAQWEDKTTFAVNKSNLTTDGVIVVGDAATGTNSSPNSMLAATTLSIKNASITGGKIAAGTVTGGNIAANTVANGNIAPLAVSTDKMANGTANSILTADGTGKVTWEAKSIYQTPKANLTTDGIIVIGDPAGAANTAANAVLAATTLSIKNGSITGGKIAAGTVTGGNIAANTVANGNIAPLAVSTDKMANGTVNSILTADGTGKVTWEAKTTYQTPKANLITGEGLVIGDANGAANTATGAVLTATTVNIKNGGITGGKIASAAIGSGHIAANAVNGTTHIANSTIPIGKLANGTADAILTTTAAGVPQWQAKASIIPVVPVVTANNGLTKTGNNIELGGTLAKVTTIATSATNQFRFTGLPAANVATDNVVMIDRGTGALKQVNSAVPNFFYLPPINIAITPGAANQTLNVYNIYNTQYGTPKAVSTPGIKLPVFTATQLNYFVLYADPAVFTSITVSAAGVITYSISATAKPSGATFITVVLQVR